MEQLLKTLEEIGLTPEELRNIAEYFREDESGLRSYVSYMRAIIDDRHEYV